MPVVADFSRVLVPVCVLRYPYVAALVGTADSDGSLSALIFFLFLVVLVLLIFHLVSRIG